MIDEKFEIELEPEPVMLPVEVKAPMLLALIVSTVRVPVEPLSVKRKSVFGEASLSLIVSEPSTPAVANLMIGLLLVSDNGAAFDNVSA